MGTVYNTRVTRVFKSITLMVAFLVTNNHHGSPSRTTKTSVTPQKRTQPNVGRTDAAILRACDSRSWVRSSLSTNNNNYDNDNTNNIYIKIVAKFSPSVRACKHNTLKLIGMSVDLCMAYTLHAMLVSVAMACR